MSVPRSFELKLAALFFVEMEPSLLVSCLALVRQWHEDAVMDERRLRAERARLREEELQQELARLQRRADELFAGLRCRGRYVWSSLPS